MQLEPDTTVENPDAGGEAPPPEEGAPASNRNFYFLIGALVVVFICLAGALGVGAYMTGQNRRANETKVAVANMTNAQAATLNFIAQNQPTATPVPPTATPVPPTATQAPSATPQPSNTPQAAVISATPLLAMTASNTPEVSATPATVTAGTPAAAAQGSKTPTATVKAGTTVTPTKGTPSVTPLVNSLTKTATPTQLPGTGFAEEAGVPMLIVATLGLVAVTVAVRRLRHSLR